MIRNTKLKSTIYFNQIHSCNKNESKNTVVRFSFLSSKTIYHNMEMMLLAGDEKYIELGFLIFSYTQ